MITSPLRRRTGCLIVHGKPDEQQYLAASGPSPSNRHWLAWLQGELLARGILTQNPEMPQPYAPVYDDWDAIFAQFELCDETMLVGHSCGAGFLLRWLGEHVDVRVKKLILVAPSLGLDWKDTSFFNFAIDPLLQDRVREIITLVSRDDRPAILEAAERIQASLPKVRTIVHESSGHFIYRTMQTAEFPELLALLTDDEAVRGHAFH